MTIVRKGFCILKMSILNNNIKYMYIYMYIEKEIIDIPTIAEHYCMQSKFDQEIIYISCQTPVIDL